MFKKLTKEELVQAIWDIRDYPEFLEEMKLVELKQLLFMLDDWSALLWGKIAKSVIKNNHSFENYDILKNDNSKYGFSFDEVEYWKEEIKAKIKPNKNKRFENLLQKFSDEFDYTAPTVKYTIIYHWLRYKNIMPLNGVEYLEHVRLKYLNGNGFKRLAFDDIYNNRYTKHEYRLNEIYQTSNFIE